MDILFHLPSTFLANRTLHFNALFFQVACKLPDPGRKSKPKIIIPSVLTFGCFWETLGPFIGSCSYFCRRMENVKMSQHSSLRSRGKMTAKRNVLKRYERIDLLRSRDKWKDGDRGTGLPKTKA